MPYEARQKDPLLMKLKIDLDNAFMEMYHNKTKKNEDEPPPQIKVEFSNFPRTEHRYFGETSLVNNERNSDTSIRLPGSASPLYISTIYETDSKTINESPKRTSIAGAFNSDLNKIPS